MQVQIIPYYLHKFCLLFLSNLIPLEDLSYLVLPYVSRCYCLLKIAKLSFVKCGCVSVSLSTGQQFSLACALLVWFSTSIKHVSRTCLSSYVAKAKRNEQPSTSLDLSPVTQEVQVPPTDPLGDTKVYFLLIPEDLCLYFGASGPHAVTIYIYIFFFRLYFFFFSPIYEGIDILSR